MPSIGRRTAPDAARVCRNVRRLKVDMGCLLWDADDATRLSATEDPSRARGGVAFLEFLRRARVKEAAVPELAVEGERRQVGHTHRIENAVEVVALVLQQHGVKPPRHTLDAATVRRLRGTPHAS